MRGDRRIDKHINFKRSDYPLNSEGDIAYYKEAISYYSKFENVKMTCEMLFKLGHSYEKLKQFKKAKKSFLVSLKLFKEEKDVEGQARCLEAIGDLSRDFNDSNAAIRYYNLSLKKYGELADNEKVIKLYGKIAHIYRAEGSYDDAERFYKKSISLGAGEETRNSLRNLQEKISNIKPGRKQSFILLGFILALVLAEVVTTYYDMQWGLLINGLILISLIVGSVVSDSPNFSNLLRSMIVLPLIRIIGLSMPIMKIDSLYWFPIISIPLFAAAFFLIRSQSMTRQSVGLVRGDLKIQIPIIFTGILFGAIEYLILKPEPLIATFTVFNVIFAGIILTISTGFAEELLFRGILQKNAENVMGKYTAILFASVIFSILHTGWMSFMDLIFVFLVAVFYGFVFQRTRSIMGISFSHGLTNIFLFVIMPFLI
jgi:membrane protease YdiL (CAAX protease family)